MTSYPITANGALCVPAQTEEYLSTLFRHVDWAPGQLVSLLGIGEKGTDRDGSDGKPPFKERQIIPPAFIGAAHAHIKRWAEHHVAAFVVPAVLHPAAAERGDVTLDKVAMLTALLLDLDSGDISGKVAFVVERLGPPTMTIASGGATEAGEIKRHLYWLLNEPSEEVDRVAAIRKQLAAKVGGDQSFGRATQVVRIPGGVHAKNGTANVCTILDRADVDYNLDDLAEIIEAMEPMPGLPVAASPSLPLDTGTSFDFAPRYDTAIDALHRDIAANGDDLTRWGEFNKVAGFNISEARAGRLTPEAAITATNGWMLEHMRPPWPQARFDQEFSALVRKDIDNHGQFPQAIIARAEGPQTIVPTPATWPQGSSIPPRPWLFGRWFQRGMVTAIIAPGGIGKSTLIAGMGLSMASGEPFLGKTIYGGPLKVWSWNLEDNGDNLARARIAAAMYYGIGSDRCGDRLFVDSGPDGATLCTAVEDRLGFTIIEPVMAAVTEAIMALGIDCLLIDPFVSSHAVNENDNNKIDAVAKRWARVAQITNTAIGLVHHSSKMHGEAVTADSARGASALNNAARATLVLNRMTPEQATAWAIDPDAARRFFNVADDKHNMAPAERADWYELKSVDLQNASDIHESDKVGVVTPWSPPKPMDGIHVNHLIEFQRVLHAGLYWSDVQAKGWAGEILGTLLKIDHTEAANKTKIKGIIATWVKSGALKIDQERDPNPARRGSAAFRPALKVGTWATP